MKNFVSLIVLACFALLLLNCKKHQDLPVIELDADTAGYGHFNYRPGSYWIYRDSLNGRMDSFYVRNNYFIKQGAENAIYDYHFVTIAEVNMDSTKVSDSANWIFNFQGQKIVMDYYYGRSGYGWKNDITYDPLFLYPFVFGDNHSNFDTATVTSTGSIITVRGTPYYVATVEQYIHLNSASGRGLTYIDDRFNVNDSIGIVSMKLYHPFDSVNHVWELVRYKISKF